MSHKQCASPALSFPALQSRKLFRDLVYISADPRIVALTAYDYTSARLLDQSGEIDVLLVGDSLANIIQGHKTTLPTSLDEMIYHARCVTRGTQRALVIGDLPFLSYQISPEQALESAGRIVKEAEVHAVKLEGGKNILPQVKKIIDAGIPVVGHLGLTPQSVLAMGGFRVQGKPEKSAGMLCTHDEICEQAKELVQAGISMLVLEGVPEKLGKELTSLLPIPVIGIGAGRYCDGQILVLHDMLGLSLQEPARFVRRYADLTALTQDAVLRFAQDVRQGAFPAEQECYEPIQKFLTDKEIVQ